MTQAEIDDIHKRLRDNKNATADRRFLLAEIDRLTAEIEKWRADWTTESRKWIAAKAEIRRLEGRDKCR